jgi:hypothetical protein
MSIIQPTHRWALWRRLSDLPPGEERDALNKASYYESFSQSYTAEQVLSAVAVMIALHDHGADSAEYRNAVGNVR